jgi:hypothetical protein
MNLTVGSFGRFKKGLRLRMIDQDDGVNWRLDVLLHVGQPLDGVMDTFKTLIGELKKAKDFQDRTGGGKC